MKISTEIHSASKIAGEECAIELIAKAGFEAWDFSMFDMCILDSQRKLISSNAHPLAGNDYLAFARKLKRIGEDNGIVCNQSHAPFPSRNKDIQSYFKRAIECSAEAGAGICVIHPPELGTPQDSKEMYEKILPFAKECGVIIATENMWDWNSEKDEACFAACATPESFLEHLDAVDDEYFVSCVDIGHAEMKGLGTTAPDMIRKIGSRVRALHVCDNDRWHDMHIVPFAGSIDFDAVAKALADIEYCGDITLEANHALDGYTKENLLDGIILMRKSADKFRKMISDEMR